MVRNKQNILKKKEVKEKFYKVDLHIHTPASSCYKGDKSNEEYLKIIKKAKDVGIKIMAITDHNSIEGYKKIIELKEDLKKESNTLSRIRDSKQTKKEIKQIRKKLALFKDILILPLLPQWDV